MLKCIAGFIPQSREPGTSFIALNLVFPPQHDNWLSIRNHFDCFFDLSNRFRLGFLLLPPFRQITRHENPRGMPAHSPKTV